MTLDEGHTRLKCHRATRGPWESVASAFPPDSLCSGVRTGENILEDLRIPLKNALHLCVTGIFLPFFFFLEQMAQELSS